MRTLLEVAEWCHGARLQFGDPAAVTCQIFARYVIDALIPTEDIVFSTSNPGELEFCLLPNEHVYPILAEPGAPIIEEDGVDTFGLQRINRGIWTLSPSLNAPGVIHAFVVLYDVPDPAPWERRIILLGDLA